MTPKPRLEMKPTSACKSPSKRRGAWGLRAENADPTAEEPSVVGPRLRVCPAAATIKALSSDVTGLDKERKAQEFDQWRQAVGESQIVELQSFGEGLNKDREGVLAA